MWEIFFFLEKDKIGDNTEKVLMMVVEQIEGIQKMLCERTLREMGCEKY